jgi:hypothetical protein
MLPLLFFTFGSTPKLLKIVLLSNFSGIFHKKKIDPAIIRPETQSAPYISTLLILLLFFGYKIIIAIFQFLNQLLGIF